MSEFARADGRLPHQLRPIRFQNGIAPHATGSTLIEWGNTRVICAVTIEDSVPKWMQSQKISGGWVTAEYSMLPYSTLDRKARDISKLKLDGRSQEIQRLIGRSLRAAVDLEALGARTVWIDCDVLQADGGTRTASITGAFVALGLALRKLQAAGKLTKSPLKPGVAAVSVGVVQDVPLLDLAYVEDRDAAVDLNLVMDGSGQFIELQASGEEATFSDTQLASMLALGRAGIGPRHRQSRHKLGRLWLWRSLAARRRRHDGLADRLPCVCLARPVAPAVQPCQLGDHLQQPASHAGGGRQ
jgi:ribonuclease PH